MTREVLHCYQRSPVLIRGPSAAMRWASTDSTALKMPTGGGTRFRHPTYLGVFRLDRMGIV